MRGMAYRMQMHRKESSHTGCKQQVMAVACCCCLLLLPAAGHSFDVHAVSGELGRQGLFVLCNTKRLP